MAPQPNPFESPKADISVPFSPEDRRGDEDFLRAERIRRQYLNHEASVKSIGLLYYLGGGILAVGMVSMLFTFRARWDGRTVIPLLTLFAFVAGAGIGGYGLRKLEGWVRIPVTILCGLGILGGLSSMAHSVDSPSSFGSVFSMVINIYILYLIWSAKGKYVCSDEYHAIIAQTPHIKYKTSLIVKIFVGLLVFVVVMGVVSFIFIRP